VKAGKARRFRVRYRVFEATIPGFFVKNSIPVWGGWSDGVVTFFVSFDSEVFPHGAEKIATKSRSEISAAEKIVA
jgi:hypothetical protein